MAGAAFVGATINSPVGGGDANDLVVPAAAQAGDLLLGVFADPFGIHLGFGSAGWTLRMHVDGSGGGPPISAFTRIANATDHGATYTFAPGGHGINSCLAYRAVAAELPDASDTGAGITAGSLTPAIADDLDVVIVATDDHSSLSAPAGWTSRVFFTDPFFIVGMLVMDRLDIPSGATGTVTPSGSGGTNPNQRWARALWLTALPYVQRNPASNHQNPAVA